MRSAIPLCMFLLLALTQMPPVALADSGGIAQHLGLAADWQERGMYRQALRQLDRAAASRPTQREMVEIERRRGDLHHLLQQWEKAGAALARSVALAREVHDDLLLAKALNNYGNLMATADLKQEAEAAFQEAIALLQSRRNVAAVHQRVTTEINLYRFYRLQKRQKEARKLRNRLLPEMAGLAGDASGIQLQLALALLIPDSDARAELLARAIAQAKATQNRPLLAMAHGMMGRLYERKGRLSAALAETRQALFFTPDDTPEQRYRWQWQLGRVLSAQGSSEAALGAYRDAVATLTPIRSMLMRSHRMIREGFFAQRIKPVYSDLAGLILEKATHTARGRERIALLHEARSVMEELKAAELQDYFQSECVTASGAQMQLEDVDPYTAIIYPIVLRDHLAVIVSVGRDIRLYNSAVDADTVRDTTLTFRRHLQTRTSNEFLHEAVRLYDWIIRPAQPLLKAHRVNQLVMVPGGALRTIPFSTLYDGRHFLIEHYALALTPGLSLTDPQPMVKQHGTTLVAGLSDAVQGFSALPSVKQEMRTVQSIMGGDRIANKAYTIPALEHALQAKEYRLIHLATHGVFGHTQEDSYLLTYDSKLNMNRLSDLLSINKRRKHPVQLLTMSACQTALGDERAALGLAGVAVQAGVRSAIATLWFVDDEATALTITNFYKLLRKPGISKARALQLAQIKLIKQQRYWHPGYWGPFLLIGNWL